MKASLKFATTQKPNKYGFPVYKILRAKGVTNLKKTIFRSLPEHWNFKTQLVTPQHPDYDTIIADLLNIKSVISAINLGLYTYEDAKSKLFGNEKQQSLVFYTAALRSLSGNTTGDLYKTILNSFNLVYPNIAISEITTTTAKTYMAGILKHQKPNGVHAYMRSLDAMYKRVCDNDSPFKGVRPKLEDTPDKDLSFTDLQKLFFTRSIKYNYDHKNTIAQINYPRYYYMLMFYLGGIDMVDLAQLRYDKHVVNGRIQFRRAKGGTTAVVNNKIFDVALDLLKYFDCYPYLVPIYKRDNYKSYVNSVNKALSFRTKDLLLSRKPLTKSARYTFINRAQDLLVDERITAQLVGHKRKTTTSIYTRNFPISVQDLAHEKIINLDLPV